MALRTGLLVGASLLAGLVVVLLGGLVLSSTAVLASGVKISSPGAKVPGAVFVWTDLDPSLSWVGVQRIRLVPSGAPAVGRMRRAASNSLPPITYWDREARRGDCFLALSGVVRRAPGSAQGHDVLTRVEFIGCLL